MLSKIKGKKHILYIILLFLICAYVMRDYLIGPYWVPMRGDPDISGTGTDFPYHASNAWVLKNGLNKWNIPLWSRYTLGGMPFFAKPQVQVFNPTWIVLMIAPNAWLGLKWAYLLHLFISGLGMYLFMHYYFKKEPKISFLTALIYMLNGNLVNELNAGHMNILNVYSWLPFILLFVLLALNEKNWLLSSIFAGIFLSFIIFGGSSQEGLFVVMLLLVVFFIHVFGRNFFKKIIKVTLVGLVIFTVFFGLSLIKILPTLELLKVTGSRGNGIPFDALVTTGFLSISNFLSLFGFVGLVLLPFVLLSLNKKKTIFFILLILFAIGILSNSPLIYFLWKYFPFVNKIRGVHKVTFLFTFPISVLLGLGASNLLSESQKRLKIANKYHLIAMYIVIVASVLVNLVIFGPKQFQFDNINFQIEKNQVMQYMSKDKDVFRFKAYETNGIDWGTDYYSIPLGLQDIYGYDNVWLLRYLPMFLSVANSQPAKIFGMLNMKYMTSMQPLNISGFGLIKKFDECGLHENGIDICQPKRSDGPYLYRNDLYLPRAYFVDNGILILGDKANSDKIGFFLMLNPKFDPSSTVIISKQSLGNMNSEILNRFKVVILTQNPSQGDVDKLRNYVSNNGLLLPNIFAQENQLSEEKINNALSSFNTNDSQVKKANIKYDDFDSAVVQLNGTKGFLVLSEQYSEYPGWRAGIDGNEVDIYTANGIVSAIYLNGDYGKLIFQYEPSSYKRGRLISFITLFVLIAYFCYFVYNKKFKFGGGSDKT